MVFKIVPAVAPYQKQELRDLEEKVAAIVKVMEVKSTVQKACATAGLGWPSGYTRTTFEVSVADGFEKLITALDKMARRYGNVTATHPGGNLVGVSLTTGIPSVWLMSLVPPAEDAVLDEPKPGDNFGGIDRSSAVPGTKAVFVFSPEKSAWMKVGDVLPINENCKGIVTSIFENGHVYVDLVAK